jgi:hypothetical protein
MAPNTIHVFLSYTRREEEVSVLQPVTDAYCDLLVRWARTRGVEVFYDRSSIPQDVTYSDGQLNEILGCAVRRSHLLVSFLSPEYIGSPWCRFEFETKWSTSHREIHKVYWKPEITVPILPRLSRLLSSARTRFVMDVLDWKRIRHQDRGYWRDTRFEEWVFLDDLHNPSNFSDLTEVYRMGMWAGVGPVARCAQKSAEILCREHPSLLTGKFREHSWFASQR